MRLIVLPLLLITAPACAHDTWLSWEQAESSGNSQVSLALTTGDTFPALGSGVAPSRLARAEVFVADGSLPLRAGLPAADALPLSAKVGKSPFVVAVTSLRPWDIELSGSTIDVYLAELGGDPQIAERHAQLGRWRERFRKHSKALIRRQNGPPSALASRAFELPFELVPEVDPTVLASGSPFQVCAYAAAKPVGPVYLGLVEADGSASWQWSDAAGCAEVRPMNGNYLLRSVRLQASALPALEWESDFAMLTVLRSGP